MTTTTHSKHTHMFQIGVAKFFTTFHSQLCFSVFRPTSAHDDMGLKLFIVLYCTILDCLTLLTKVTHANKLPAKVLAYPINNITSSKCFRQHLKNLDKAK